MQLYDILTTSRSAREASARSDKIRHLVSRYRPDKKAEEADTIETIRALYERRLNKGG
jgi:hypothetical protein